MDHRDEVLFGLVFANMAAMGSTATGEFGSW